MSSAQALINKVRLISQDNLSPFRHSDESLIGWLNDAQKSIIQLRPDANTNLVEFTPESDQVEQDVTSIGHLLVDVVSNSPTGRTVRRTDLATLDDFTPDWRSEEMSDTPRVWANNPASPTAFWLSPKPTAAVELRVLVAQTPVALTEVDDEFTISEVYDSPLVNYTLSRVFEIDNDMELAMMHSQSFQMELGLTKEIIDGAKA